VRSRGTGGQGKRERDLIEAGLSEPAGMAGAVYGDCVAGALSETPDWLPAIRLLIGRQRLVGMVARGWKQAGP